MNKVMIGSRAILHWFPDFPRDPSDTDYAVLEKDKDGDCMIIPLVVNNSLGNVALPEMLLTLKISHIFWDNNWEKHMFDIQFLLGKGVQYDKELMLKLKNHWTTHYNGLYRSDLTQTSKDFFDNALNCPYQHDDIHKAINNPPTYTKVLIGEVEPCPKKFQNLTQKEKDALVIEEVMVMAYERYRKQYYKKAYFTMFKKYVRNHVPMFMLDYVLRNYVRLSYCKLDFITKLDDVFEKYDEA